MFGQETAGFVVALVDDAEHLFVYGTGGLLAEGLLARIAPSSKPSSGPSSEVRRLARGELHRPELLAHPPAGDHSPRQVGGLLDVALGPSGPGAVDDLLRAASAQSTDDPRPEVRFRVVVAVVLGTLVGYPQGLPPRHDR